MQSVRRVTEVGDNYIQNFHLGRHIVGYTVRNFVLQCHVSGAVKQFLLYKGRYSSRNENFEYGYPHSNVFITFTHGETQYFAQNVSLNDVKLLR